MVKEPAPLKVRQPVIVKVSGDLWDRNDVIEWIRKKAAEYYVVVLVGGGTQINKAFEQRGLKIGEHGPLGRETNSFEERQLARDVLERNQAELQDLLFSRGIFAIVVKPVLEIGDVLCHVNGDIYILTVYHGFDKIYVLTTESRVKAKKRELKKYLKIEVVGFPDKAEN